ncbi:MAG: hypothetical protein RL518_1966 [Pseudomonadota bacterium]
MQLGFADVLRQRISAIHNLGEALNAVGKLDALLSLAALPDRFGSDGCYPDLGDGSQFFMQCRSIHNPVLYLKGASIGNDFECTGGTPRLLTGPNSGGKTTLVTSIFESQILAQLGTAVPALQYEATVTDKFVFQGPSFAALDEHGRFGTELLATREAFLQATPRSLVVLDEVGDGTTAEERNDFAAAVIWGFSKIRCGVFLVTHNIALADRLSREGTAEVYQMEFDQAHPTFKVRPGISRCSNAERVARALQFAPEDIDRILRERGYHAT